MLSVSLRPPPCAAKEYLFGDVVPFYICGLPFVWELLYESAFVGIRGVKGSDKVDVQLVCGVWGFFLCCAIGLLGGCAIGWV